MLQVGTIWGMQRIGYLTLEYKQMCVLSTSTPAQALRDQRPYSWQPTQPSEDFK